MKFNRTTILEKRGGARGLRDLGVHVLCYYTPDLHLLLRADFDGHSTSGKRDGCETDDDETSACSTCCPESHVVVPQEIVGSAQFCCAGVLILSRDHFWAVLFLSLVLALQNGLAYTVALLVYHALSR